MSKHRHRWQFAASDADRWGVSELYFVCECGACKTVPAIHKPKPEELRGNKP